MYYEKLQSLSEVSQADLGIPASFRVPLDKPIAEMKKLPDCNSPLEMLQCLQVRIQILSYYSKEKKHFPKNSSILQPFFFFFFFFLSFFFSRKPVNSSHTLWINFISINRSATGSLSPLWWICCRTQELILASPRHRPRPRPQPRSRRPSLQMIWYHF